MNYVLKISLCYISEPEVWRKVSVPEGLSFEQLHFVIQAAFGWENSHLYAFCERSLGDLFTINTPVDADAFVTADKIYVDKLFINLFNRSQFAKENSPLYYIYDYGDEWRHSIEVLDINPSESAGLSILDGAGACPPEDCGGPPMYNALKVSLEAETEGIAPLPMGFDPAYFDLDAAKARIREIERLLL